MTARTQSHPGPCRAARTALILAAACLSTTVALGSGDAHAAAPMYSAASPFNQPIAAAPALDPRSSTMVGGLVASRNATDFAVSAREWTIPAYVADAGTPRYDVAVTSRPPGWRTDGTWRQSYETVANVPIPDQAQPDPMGDGHMTVLDPASNCEYDFYAAKSTLGGTTILRPNADVTSGWVRRPVDPPLAAWQVLDDFVTQPTAASSTDYLQSAGGSGVTEVALADATLSPTASAGKVWFSANTSATTRLKVEVVWQGAVHASTIVARSSGYAWRSIDVLAPAQAALNDMRLRFTALDGTYANVRAAYYALTTTGRSWSANWGDTIRTDGDGIYPDGMSTRASGFSLAGMIWPDELRAGAIDHALVFAYPYTKAGGPVWPATAADGLSTRADAMPIGARVQLDPALDLDSLGLSPYELTIARALQKYGMILGDTGGALSVYAVGAPSSGIDPYAGLLSPDPYSYLSKIPVGRFRVLAMGAQNTRTAPPVAPSGCGAFR